MKKLLLICFLLAMFLVITIGANADKYMWNAGTTGEGTNNYVLMGILAETINTYVGDYIFMTPIAYTKSLVGLKGFDQKEVVSMYGSAQQFEQVIEQKGPFSPETYKWTAPFMQWLWTSDEEFFWLIRKEDADKIKSWSDLANRPIYPHMRGTGTYEMAKTILGPDGLDVWDTIEEKAFEYSHAGDALKLKEVDAVLANSRGGTLTGWVQEVLVRTDCIMLVPTPEEVEKIIKGVGFLFRSTMNPEDYSQDVGITTTVINPSLGFIYIVDPDVPEEAVYYSVKAAFENAAEMAKSSAQWKRFAQDPWEYNLPYLMKYKKMGVPIHPGALRYFRELGHDTKLLGLE